MLAEAFYDLVRLYAIQSSDTYMLTKYLSRHLYVLVLATSDPFTGEERYRDWRLSMIRGTFVLPVANNYEYKIILVSYIPIANLSVIAYTLD